MYRIIDDYRADRKTSALTTFDIQTVIESDQAYEIKPERVLKHIVLGNACSWRTYEIAHNYYENCIKSMNALIEGIIDKM